VIPPADITQDRTYRHFPSFAAYARACIDTGLCQPAGNSDWTFGHHWRDAEQFLEAMEAGRAEPGVMAIARRLRISAAGAMTNSEGPTRRRRRVWAEQGDEVDVDRMLADKPRAWQCTAIGRPAPIVRILAMFDCNGTCNTEQFGAAAAAVALASDALATAGYAFEVWAIQHGTGLKWERMHTVTACVKGAGEPLDLERVASVYTLGAIRYLGFGLIRHDMHPTDVGRCRTPDAATLAICSATGSIRPEQFSPSGIDADAIARAALSLIPAAASKQETAHV